MKISAYFYIFNARKMDFDILGAVDNFCNFFDEVICATIESEDDTRVVLSELEKKYSNFKVIDSNITYRDNRFDGKLKTLAMKNCTNKIKVIADADERFPMSQREIWRDYARDLEKIIGIDGFFIPVIDLYGDESKIRSNISIGQKFRMHKNTVIERGVPKIYDRGDRFLTDFSDSTEPLDINGNLCKFTSIINQTYLNPIFASFLQKTPLVFHYGFLDLQRRAKIGKEFWKERWQERSKREENVATSINQLIIEPIISHNLLLT